jgi:hypothetical protein
VVIDACRATQVASTGSPHRALASEEEARGPEPVWTVGGTYPRCNVGSDLIKPVPGSILSFRQEQIPYATGRFLNPGT